jgi:hypothetical protein
LRFAERNLWKDIQGELVGRRDGAVQAYRSGAGVVVTGWVAGRCCVLSESELRSRAGTNEYAIRAASFLHKSLYVSTRYPLSTQRLHLSEMEKTRSNEPFSFALSVSLTRDSARTLQTPTIDASPNLPIPRPILHPDSTPSPASSSLPHFCLPRLYPVFSPAHSRRLLVLSPGRP